MYSVKTEKHTLNGNSVNLKSCEGPYEELLLQVSGSGSITVTGALECDLDPVGVAVINMATLEKVENIAESGIYLLPTKGLKSCILTATGQVDVFAKFLQNS